MAPHPTNQDWRCIAEQASKENDPAKLARLVTKLCRALDDEREQKREFRPQEDQIPPSPQAAQQNAE